MSEHGAWITRSYVHLWRKPELGKLSKYEKTVQPLVKVLLLSELKCLNCLLSKMVCVFGWKWEHSTCSLDSFMSHPLYHPLFKKLTRPAPFCSLGIAKTPPQIVRRVNVSVCVCVGVCEWVCVCVCYGGENQLNCIIGKVSPLSYSPTWCSDGRHNNNNNNSSL